LVVAVAANEEAATVMGTRVGPGVALKEAAAAAVAMSAAEEGEAAMAIG
jgi:hypothetical protein